MDIKDYEGNNIGRDEAGTEVDLLEGNISGLGQKYFRPWTALIPSLDGNISVLGRGRDGARFSEREYVRPWKEIFLSLDGMNSVLGWN